MSDSISRQAAIDIVDFECGEWRGLAKTIEQALEQLPSAQPEVANDTNVPTNDCISRQAVKEIRNDGTYIGYSLFPDDDNADYANGFTDAINKVLALPSAQPEPSIPISWIEGHIDWLKDMDNGFANITAMNIEIMLRKWREEQNETD